ncbi:hypothetical protein [Paenibacillus sp. FSL H8-0332]
MSYAITRFKCLGDYLRSRRDRLQPEAVSYGIRACRILLLL